MKELQFLLSLKNNLSKPLGQAKQSLASFTKQSQKSLKATGIGAAGLLGAGLALKGIIGPANELQNALDELGTRNVAADTLNDISKAAAKFSTDYGTSAVDFVNSTIGIKSALRDLTDKDLPRAAVAANTLAYITKTSGADAAGYIADLSNRFVAESTRMGQANFAENIASRTAWLVKNTGQDMAKVQALIQGSKGTGSSYGIGMDEQLAVLSSLGGSIGSAAGGAYDAFLKNARKGAKELGLSFTDAQGQLLAFPDILDKLQAKYGNSVAGNVALQEKLNKAFGKGAVALTKSWGSSAKLRKDIIALSGSNGLGTAAQLAADTADSWERLAQLGTRVRIAIGKPLLKAIQPGVDSILQGGIQFAKWLEMFPNISRQIGYLTISIIALTAANAAGTLIAGVAGMVWGSLRAVWFVTTGVLKGLVWVLNLKARALQVAAIWTVLQAAVMGKLRAAILITTLAMRGFALSTTYSNMVLLAQRAGMVIATVAMWAYGTATAFAGVAMQLLMSPVTLVIAAIALLAAGVWYAVTHWDELKASIMDSSAFKFISSVVTAFGGLVGKVIEGLKNMFTGFWSWVKNSAIDSLNWLIGKLNKIPGVDIDLAGKDVTPEITGLPAPAGLKTPDIERGSVAKNIASSSKVDNSRHNTEFNFYPPNGATFQSILETAELAAP